jgi:hypothetical protein
VYPTNAELGTGNAKKARASSRIPRWKVTRHRALFGVRTFLPRPAVTGTEAILRLSKTAVIIPKKQFEASCANIQIPTSNIQRNSKHQAPIKWRIENWLLVILWSLELGIWSF